MLFTTIPGLSLFCGGLVRTKNLPSILMPCLGLTGLLTLVCLVVGHCLAFDAEGMSAGQAGRAAFIGVASGWICYEPSTRSKRAIGYDDSLDVFGVHGVGGFGGTVLAGLFGATTFGGNQDGLAIGAQPGKQLYAALMTAAWSAIASFALLGLVDAAVGLRVDEEAESRGLDLALHEERGCDF